jgi:hypothetical protein
LKWICWKSDKTDPNQIKKNPAVRRVFCLTANKICGKN